MLPLTGSQYVARLSAGACERLDWCRCDHPIADTVSIYKGTQPAAAMLVLLRPSLLDHPITVLRRDYLSFLQLTLRQQLLAPQTHHSVRINPVAKCDWNSMGIFLSRQIQLNSHAVLFDRSGATNRIPVTLILRTG